MDVRRQKTQVNQNFTQISNRNEIQYNLYYSKKF